MRSANLSDFIESAARWRARLRVVAVIGALLALYLALAYGIYAELTARSQGANDFYSRWVGARALVLRGEDPYSLAVTQEIQMGMYGRLAAPNEDQVAFAYPLYAALLAAPLVSLPYPAAQALWMALLCVGTVAGALAVAYVNRVRLSPAAFSVITLATLTFYPTVRGVFLGQYALLSFALVALAGLAIYKRRPILAGVLLAVATVKPQPVILLLPLILFWAWHNGQRRIVASAAVTWAALMAVSFLLAPNWMGEFLAGLGRYAEYAPVGPPLETFFELWLPNELALLLSVAVGAALVGWLAIWAWQNRAAAWSEWQPIVGFAALVTTLIAGRIGTPDQILLILFWIPLLRAWWARGNRFAVALAMLGLIVAPWYGFLSLLQGNREAIVVTTILPLASLAMWLGTWLRAPRRVQTAP